MQSFRPIQVPRRICTGLVAVVQGVVAPSLSAATAAPDERLRLIWTAPPECPSLDEIRADVRSLLSRKSVAASALIAVDASIEVTEDGRYALSVLVDGQTRKITGASCAKLAQAAALLMALLLDPELATADETQARPTPPDPRHDEAGPTNGSVARPHIGNRPANPQLSHVEPTSASETSSARSNSPAMALVELAGRFDFGSWPELEPAFIAGIGVESSHWRMLAHAGLGKRLVLRTAQSDQIQFVPVTVSLEPALRFAHRQWGLETGVGAELGVTHSLSNQLEPRDHDALSLAIVVLLRGTRDLGAGIRGWIGLGAAIPVIRPRWISMDGELYHAFGPALRNELGVQMRF